MEIFLIRLLQFMLAISILVLLHEGGHYFFARLFGVRVEKFYLFFDPWFHLFEFKSKKRWKSDFFLFSYYKKWNLEMGEQWGWQKSGRTT